MVFWPHNVGRRMLDIVDSTNAEGRRIAAETHRPTWIQAGIQTAGRGRFNRPWLDARGNLAATLVMPIDENDIAPLRSFVAALALYDACRHLADGTSCFRLKWPNDLLLNRGKMAGILLESIGRGARRHLIAGFGVNLASAPMIIDRDVDAPPPVSLVGETGRLVTPDDFLPHLAMSFETREAQLKEAGFESLRQDWQEAADGIGDNVRVSVAGKAYRGKFEGISASGEAVLLMGSERIHLAAGDMIMDSENERAPCD
ncbi:MAG: biotin--[acetyl-CoA-carboxylase] ligase [Rhodobacteraceae bacterium]|nr:biotin--[acetyl-CoA-carboxylase] ligase [Paracoccaceae bacterium]